MASRTIYLVTSRNVPSQRAHFAIFVPSKTLPDQGTLIQAVGAPMTGYILEFKRNYSPFEDSLERYTLFPIGEVDSSHIADPLDEKKTSDATPRDNIEAAATQIPTPGLSDNFLAPVNDTSNKRCQEWTMEFIRYLVGKGYLGSDAIQIVQSKRDPPSYGVGLQPALRRGSEV